MHTTVKPATTTFTHRTATTQSHPPKTTEIPYTFRMDCTTRRAFLAVLAAAVAVPRVFDTPASERPDFIGYYMLVFEEQMRALKYGAGNPNAAWLSAWRWKTAIERENHPAEWATVYPKLRSLFASQQPSKIAWLRENSRNAFND